MLPTELVFSVDLHPSEWVASRAVEMEPNLINETHVV